MIQLSNLRTPSVCRERQHPHTRNLACGRNERGTNGKMKICVTRVNSGYLGPPTYLANSSSWKLDIWHADGPQGELMEKMKK